MSSTLRAVLTNVRSNVALHSCIWQSSPYDARPVVFQYNLLVPKAPWGYMHVFCVPVHAAHYRSRFSAALTFAY